MGKEGWAFLGWEDYHRPLCVESILLMWLKMFWMKVRKATVMWLSLGGFTQFHIMIQNNLHAFNMSIHPTWRITPYTNKQAQISWQSNPGLQTDFRLTTRFPPSAPYGLSTRPKCLLLHVASMHVNRMAILLEEYLKVQRKGKD